MAAEPGGGASRSTDPAAGSSAATDVSLREYLMSQLEAFDRHISAELASLRREAMDADDNARRAVEVAAFEAKERLTAHNGLIGKMEDQAAHFATRESVEDYKKAADMRFSRVERFQSMLTGAMLLISVIGIANLVKVWGG